MLTRMTLTTSTILLTIAGFGCEYPAYRSGLANRREPQQTLPDEPVDQSQLNYETRANTVYFMTGPYQTSPPKILPRASRVQLLDVAHEPGYVAIRTEAGLEAFVAEADVRPIEQRGIQLERPDAKPGSDMDQR